MKSDVIQRLELSPEDFDALPVTLDVRGVDYLELRAGEPDEKAEFDPDDLPEAEGSSSL